MRFNLYQLRIGDKPLIFRTELSDDKILEYLIRIEKEIVTEYLKEQHDKLGIKSLGNQLRYNPTLKSIFDSKIGQRVIVKLTENRRAFIKVFTDSFYNYRDSDIYFFILESEFGTASKLVDNSFIRAVEIEQELTEFFKNFSVIGKMPNIYFIEMTGFDDFHLYQNDGFTKIELRK